MLVPMTQSDKDLEDMPVRDRLESNNWKSPLMVILHKKFITCEIYKYEILRTETDFIE